MPRQQSLNHIWKRLLIIFLVLGAVAIGLATFGGNARVPALVFLFGNVGAYVSIHRSLGILTDDEISGLADSWLGLIVPSFVGGILAFIIYLLFLSNIISGELFPFFEPDSGAATKESFDMIWSQHAKGVPDYAKLLFWSFVAGFNQKYAVDIIESIKTKT
jgi:hypothetical protein